MPEPPLVRFSAVWMDEREIAAVARVIRSGWVTQGPEVAELEREFAAFVRAPFACAVSNGTAALHLALMAAGLGAGDEIITASHSFIATTSVIRYVGATPVFADVSADTFNLEPSRVAAAITPRTRAILCVHQLGMPCDLFALQRIAQQHGLLLIEDAACALGSEIRVTDQWQRIGQPHGDFACFSFHPRKLASTGEGGMIVTTREDWDRRCRLFRHHGMDLPDAARDAAKGVLIEQYPVWGFNYRLADILAAIGREQLRRVPEILRRRRHLALRYRTLLNDVPGVTSPQEPAWARSNWQSYCIRLPDHVDQRRVMQQMRARGIATRRGVMCAHLEAAHRDLPLRFPLPNAESARDRCILLPLHHALTDAEQERVVEALTLACRQDLNKPRRAAVRSGHYRA